MAPENAATLDGATLERVMREALRVGDVKGVHAALSVMATTDPRRAERLLGTLQDALALAHVVNTAPPAMCPTKTPEPHELGEFPMTCYSCHIEADS